jgi:DNA-binding transcriptional MerR regulator
MEDPDSIAETRGATHRRPIKSEAAFRTISEVSEDLDVPQHVLRFWESKFTQIKPLKRGGGRRYYRPEDVRLLSSIRDLLYRDGYTIRGVQKLLREPAARSRPGAVPPHPEPAAEPVEESGFLDEAGGTNFDSGNHGQILRAMLTELLDLRRLLADARRK